MAKGKLGAPGAGDGDLAGHRGLHRPGARKGEVHEAFDRDGPAAAQALAPSLGLKEGTYPNWADALRRQSEKAARVPVNVSIDAALVASAKELDVNMSRAAESGIAAEVLRVRRERWLEENRRAIESSNEFVDKHGLPLAKHRMF